MPQGMKSGNPLRWRLYITPHRKQSEKKIPRRVWDQCSLLALYPTPNPYNLPCYKCVRG